MSFKCFICGKCPTAGKSVSHSKKTSNRVFKPNLQRRKIVIKNSTRREYVCTSCLKSGKAKIAI